MYYRQFVSTQILMIHMHGSFNHYALTLLIHSYSQFHSSGYITQHNESQFKTSDNAACTLT